MLKRYIITPGLQKVLVDPSYKTAKSMDFMDKVVFGEMLPKTDSYNRKETKTRISGREKNIKNSLDDVRRFLNLPAKLKGRRVEKFIFPSNIIDIYTRIKVILGLKLSDHTKTLIEASNLID